jgi:GT2 family glycosyltransferase
MFFVRDCTPDFTLHIAGPAKNDIMRLAYICTNYNNSQETVAAAKSLLENGGHEYRIIVVDNDSANSERQQLSDLQANHAEVDVVFNPDNVGYFGGLNVGLRRLKDTYADFEYVVVGNNDLLFPAGFTDSVELCRPLFELYPVISPSIVTLDGEHQNPHVVTAVSPIRERIYDLYYGNYYLARFLLFIARMSRPFNRRGDEARHDRPGEIRQGHGSCYLLGPRFFSNFTALWAPTFLFSEEFFLAKQMEEKGLRIYFEPSISVRHMCHVTVGQLPTRKRWELMKEAHAVYRRHNPISAQIGRHPPSKRS